MVGAPLRPVLSKFRIGPTLPIAAVLMPTAAAARSTASSLSQSPLKAAFMSPSTASFSTKGVTVPPCAAMGFPV